MTVIELTKILPPPIAHRLIDNIMNSGDKRSISKLKTGFNFRGASPIIGGLFEWRATPEGSYYWEKIYRSLGDYL